MAGNDERRLGGKSELRRSILTNTGAGSLFGLVFAIIFLQFNDAPWPNVYFVAGITAFAGACSGLSSMGATLLDQRLVAWGMKNNQHRAMISFAVVSVGTFGLAFIIATFLGLVVPDPQLQLYVVFGVIAGLLFGAIVAVISYRNDKIREQMLRLEMENRHLAELASREELLREAARNLAVAEERNRMARELHDSISQGVHGIVYSLRSLERLLEDNSRGLEILGHLEQTADGTLKELRRLVMELSPSPLEDQGLEEALQLHCDLFARRQQLELTLDLDYHGGLTPEQEVAIYRITQEALTNIYKHAEAKQVSVALKGGAGRAQLVIQDDGKGFEPETATGGHGLANMATRARQNGGNFELEAAPGQGTRLRVSFVH